MSGKRWRAIKSSWFVGLSQEKFPLNIHHWYRNLGVSYRAEGRFRPHTHTPTHPHTPTHTHTQSPLKTLSLIHVQMTQSNPYRVKSEGEPHSERKGLSQRYMGIPRGHFCQEWSPYSCSSTPFAQPFDPLISLFKILASLVVWYFTCWRGRGWGQL